MFVYVWIGLGEGEYMCKNDNKEHSSRPEMTSSEPDCTQQEWEKLWKIKYLKIMKKRVIFVVVDFSCYIPEIKIWLEFMLVFKTTQSLES